MDFVNSLVGVDWGFPVLVCRAGRVQSLVSDAGWNFQSSCRTGGSQSLCIGLGAPVFSDVGWGSQSLLKISGEGDIAKDEIFYNKT